MTPETILEKMNAIKAENPKLYARNLAAEIGVSEGELLAAQIGEHIVRLRPEMIDILQSLEPLGKLMGLTRNESCVIECKGLYHDGKFNKHGKMTMGLFIDHGGIDLRLIMMHWKHIFAVHDPVKGNSSLQFFNKAGEALHKIYLTDGSDVQAYDKLVEVFKSDDQSLGMIVEPMDPSPENKADEAVNWEKFRSHWENLKDVHDFHPMLRKFKVARLQAFRKIGQDFAYPVEVSASRRVLELAKEKNGEIMTFVGNKGCIQINTGVPNKLMEKGPWFNVLDPDFNLHLDESRIAQTWVTRKPTVDGLITSVESIDYEGNTIITFYGRRTEGEKELALWREIVDLLPKKELSDAAE